MNLQRWTNRPASSERGSALVAAVGVAVIGVMMSVIVVAVAIVSVRDSGRDRVRTSEIHAAESVLDITMLALETGAPCTIADTVVGVGTTAVTVHVDVEYFSATAPLTTCSNGAIVGTPVKAVVTSTATPVEATVAGAVPSRTIEATVNIKPIQVASAGSAVFSGGTFTTGAGFRVESLDPSVKARVWIDSGNWLCNTSMTIAGDLVVVNGSATFGSASCQVTGNVWAKTNFTANSVPAGAYTIGGDLVVKAGTITINNPQKFNGNVSASGVITTQWQWENGTTVKGTTCSASAFAGSVCPAARLLPDYAPMGFPQIDYKLSDWTALGFPATALTKANLATTIINSWPGISASAISQINAMNCTIPVQKRPNTSGVPINLPSTKTIYDLRGCTLGNSGGTAKFRLYEDVVFFAAGFNSSNGMVFESGDGLPHTAYLIVPIGAVSGTPTGYVSGNISFSTGVQVTEPAQIFLYSPKNVTFPNTSNTRGQIYGGTVAVDAGSGVFKFSAVPLPGGYLGTSTSSSSGSTIEVVSKNES